METRVASFAPVAAVSRHVAKISQASGESLGEPLSWQIAAINRKFYLYAADLRTVTSIAGYYRKVFVWWTEGLNLSEEGVKVFDADFGRIALLTCFDLNFDEVWQEAQRKGAEIVFWPSAYGGGMPLNGYAMIHNYYVVAVGNGNMIDMFGKTIESVEQPCPKQFITTLDLDLTIVHTDFTLKKLAKLLREHPDEVELVSHLKVEQWYVLRAVKPGMRVRDLCKQYQIETL